MNVKGRKDWQRFHGEILIFCCEEILLLAAYEIQPLLNVASDLVG